jgi:hypothetical protein
LKWSFEPNDITVNHGEKIDIKCSADGNPKPKIEWFMINDGSSEISINYMLDFNFNL